jgi:hypothetical protein
VETVRVVEPLFALVDPRLHPHTPSIRDRVVQAAVKIVLEPIFEATCCHVRLGSGPSGPRTTTCRSSLTSLRGSALDCGVGHR